MKSYRVRWDGWGSLEGEKVVSVVTYSLPAAEGRQQQLIDAHVKGVEIFRVKPGTYEEIPEDWV